MNYSFNDVCSSLSKEKRKSDSLWIKCGGRYFSLFLSWLFLKFGWSANFVSALSLFEVLFASILLSIDNNICRLIGVLLINLWLILDCVDGNMARTVKRKSIMGEFFDAVSGYGAFAFSIIGVSIAAFHTTLLIPEEYKYIILIVGGVASALSIYSRLIHQKYVFYLNAANIVENNMTDDDDKHSLAYFRKRVDMEIGMAGLFMPWLIVAWLTNTFEIMLAFYAFYYTASFVLVLLLYLYKAGKLDRQRG